MRGITTLYQMPSGTGDARNKDMVRLRSPIGVPGVESIVIPSGTRGFFLRAVDESLVLVHWEVLFFVVRSRFYYFRIMIKTVMGWNFFTVR